MRVLVTGASGFIGRHVVARLRNAHDVLAPTHGELDVADAVAVRRLLTKERCDAVVHTSVKPGHRRAADPTGLLQDNLRQFFSLARNRGEFGRFVVVGSGAAYGVQRPLVRVTEEQVGEVVPDDEHGLSKYVEALWLADDADAVELRPFGVYGPGEDYAIRFISNACCRALLGLPVTLRRDRLFSYVWVEDLAAVVERALDDGPSGLPPGAYNVTPGDPVSLRDLADRVIAACGREVPVLVAEEGKGPEYSGDGTKLTTAWVRHEWTSIDEGIRRLRDWYRARIGEIEHAVLTADR